MAYKPKYAQTGKKKPDIIRQPSQPRQDKQPKPDVRKENSTFRRVLAVLLAIFIVPASCFATAQVLGFMAQNLSRPKAATVTKTADATLQANVSAFVQAQLEEARAVIAGGDHPEIEEEEEIVRKLYWIEEGTQVAPEPDQSKFGQSNDPAVLTQLLADAAWLLDGQTTYFQPEGQRYENSTVNYYLDDSILAITWQEVHDGSVYTFSEIKVGHASQFRRHLAGGEYGSDIQYLTTEMAASVNAVVASAGDFYRFRDFGAVVYEGQAKRVEGTYAETCYIDSSGDMHFTYGGDVLTVEEVQTFVDAHDIQFSLAFGPILVDDYQPVSHDWYGVGEINEGYARAALLQMDTLHYIVVAANTTGAYQEIPTVKQFARNVAATGCRMAYCLDGGQTATIVMNDELMNRPVYGQQRKISDIIYFATAVPEGGADIG